jgi:RsiW-degrading membrane proteinase PrsW (M82 family)
MAHLHYEEEQRFSNVTWVWVAFALLLLAALTLPLMSDSVSEKDMTSILLSTLFAFLPMAGLLLFAKFQFRIDEKGLHYRFFPAIFKWRTITKNNIESFEVSAKKNFWEKIECGYGYRHNRFKKTISMNVTGSKFARINLADGRKLKIGTVNPESMERALRQLTSTDNY